MPAPNSPSVVNPSLDAAYFESKGFAPDVAAAMASGEAAAALAAPAVDAPQAEAAPAKPSSK